MEKITKFVSIDKREFDNEISALRHENEYLRKKIKENTEYEVRIDKKSQIPPCPGIYLWVNIGDGYKRYVGSTNNLKKRYHDFLNNKIPYAGREIAKARKRKDSFWNYTILELCDEKRLKEREKYYMSVLEAMDVSKGYNLQEVRTEKKEKLTTIKDELRARYISLCHLYKINFSLEEFHKKLEELAKMPQKGISVVSFTIKNILKKDWATSLDNLSVVSTDMSKFMKYNTWATIDGLPPGIKFYDNNTYAYMFSFNKILHTEAFPSPQEAYIALLKKKMNILKEINEKDKDAIDEDTYEMVKNMSLEDIEHIMIGDWEKSYLNSPSV